jgi:hypothetical protein
MVESKGWSPLIHSPSSGAWIVSSLFFDVENLILDFCSPLALKI